MIFWTVKNHNRGLSQNSHSQNHHRNPNHNPNNTNFSPTGGSIPCFLTMYFCFIHYWGKKIVLLHRYGVSSTVVSHVRRFGMNAQIVGHHLFEYVCNSAKNKGSGWWATTQRSKLHSQYRTPYLGADKMFIYVHISGKNMPAFRVWDSPRDQQEIVPPGNTGPTPSHNAFDLNTRSSLSLPNVF